MSTLCHTLCLLRLQPRITSALSRYPAHVAAPQPSASTSWYAVRHKSRPARDEFRGQPDVDELDFGLSSASRPWKTELSSGMEEDPIPVSRTHRSMTSRGPRTKADSYGLKPRKKEDPPSSYGLRKDAAPSTLTPELDSDSNAKSRMKSIFIGGLGKNTTDSDPYLIRELFRGLADVKAIRMGEWLALALSHCY